MHMIVFTGAGRSDAQPLQRDSPAGSSVSTISILPPGCTVVLMRSAFCMARVSWSAGLFGCYKSAFITIVLLQLVLQLESSIVNWDFSHSCINLKSSAPSPWTTVISLGLTSVRSERYLSSEINESSVRKGQAILVEKLQKHS